VKKFVNVRALAFDFDGTLVESLDIKTQAFRELFKDQPRIAKQFVRFHLEHQGISRVEKIKYAYRELLKKPLSEKQLKAHCNEFSDYVLRAVIRCPFVPGALPFLKKMKQKKAGRFIELV
jgi:beta-phosphoglucomutase-like phosphatase (HAD superfamily)